MNEQVADRLYRNRDDRMLGGVAGGVADYFGIDPTAVRIVWAVLALFSGGALIVLYIVMWVIVPEEPAWTGLEAAGPAGATGAAGASGAMGTTAVGALAAAEAGASGSTTEPGGTGAPASAEPGTTDWRAQRALERAQRRAARRGRRSGSDRGGAIFVGVVLILVGTYFLVEMYFPWLDPGRWWPLVLVAIGLVMLVGAVRREPPVRR